MKTTHTLDCASGMHSFLEFSHLPRVKMGLCKQGKIHLKPKLKAIHYSLQLTTKLKFLRSQKYVKLLKKISHARICREKLQTC